MAEQFGNYEILKRLATGGMAEVFLAKQTGLGGFERLVCIKRILPHLGEQEDFVKMFQDEARIAANLIHPNIAQIYDIGAIDGAYYIAMEYVRGEDLRRVYNQEVARGRAMPLEPAAQIAMGAATGLDYAHRQTSIDGRPLGLVHRDVSPQNILTTYDGHVKLVDFGVAKAAGKMSETRTGVLKGKYSYMSPEQASGDPVDARTDIFALGITLYEVTTGVRLFKRDNEIDTLHAVIACKITPPHDIIPGYDPELERVVLRALALDPDERYPGAGEMAADLENFLKARDHPTGAQSLGAYMQDLFAEKLADQLLFGRQGWEETMTPSPEAGRRGARVGTGRRDSDRSPAVAANEVTAIAPDAGQETIANRRRALGFGSDSAARKREEEDPDWVSGGSLSHTATHAPGEQQPPEDALKRTGPRMAWWSLVVASILIGLGIAGALRAMRDWRGPEGPRSGSLAIDSEPRGARVELVGPKTEALNNRYEGHRTPFTVSEGLPVEVPLYVRFIKEGYEILEQRVAKLEEGVVPRPLFAELTPEQEGEQAGSLILLSDPKGAEVWIDERRIEGRTPLTDVRVSGGETHKVEFRLEGHASRWESIFVEPGARRFIEMILHPEGEKREEAGSAKNPSAGRKPPATQSPPRVQPTAPERPKTRPRFAHLTLTAPLTLRVVIDGRFVGQTPIRELQVEPGMRRVTLESPEEGFTLQRKVRLAAGEKHSIDVLLGKGYLSVNADPWAWVRVGKAAPKSTPTRVAVYEGNYTVVFECPGGALKRAQVSVHAGQVTPVRTDCRD